MSEQKIYIKNGDKYEEIAPFLWSGFPSDGIWIVKYRDGRESSASCIARLDDLPDPYPFYSMMLDRDTISKFLLNTFDGKPISLQEAADKLIELLAGLNQPQMVKDLKHPRKPRPIELKIPNKNTIL